MFGGLGDGARSRPVFLFGGSQPGSSSGPTITVGVTKVVKKSLGRQITLSSELVPFQEIDVYAKESGYVKKLMVDYGTHVKAGEVMAILEIPELEAQLQEDQAEIKNAANQVTRAQHELERYQAQYKALHLQYTRLNGVFESQPGIVAQQEVDDARAKTWRLLRKWMLAKLHWKPHRASFPWPRRSWVTIRACSTIPESRRRLPGS